MKPFIYVHELIENSGGSWIGCPSEDVVHKSHTEGETGEEVIALVKLSDAQARIEELEEALKGFVNWERTQHIESLFDDHELWKRAEQVLENKQ
ncbi:hypothetical protein [Robertmurraya sp.]|uniref:hypothetical protein n=1 Tax=Robertmurraya sp. TaxID=2837525 RepID=UPI003703F1D7